MNRTQLPPFNLSAFTEAIAMLHHRASLMQPVTIADTRPSDEYHAPVTPPVTRDNTATQSPIPSPSYSGAIAPARPAAERAKSSAREEIQPSRVAEAIPVDLATRCGPFAGLLAPAGRSALAEALEAGTLEDDQAQVEGQHLTSERGLSASIIGKRLILAREINGLSQTELAKALGYKNSAQLSQWEQCKRPPPIAGLIAAADALGVSTDYLLGRCDDPERDLRAVRRNSCLRAVRTVLTAATERIADAFDTDERVIGAGTADIRALLDAANACVANARGARGETSASKALTGALERLEDSTLKVSIALKRHDDEDARQRERLAQVAANDAG